LYYGNRTNELQGLGFEHMLRVQQAELVSKSAHFLVEHERWHNQGQNARSRLDDQEQQFIKMIETKPHPDDPGEQKKQQAAEVTNMAGWLEQNSHTSPTRRPVVFDKSREFYLLESLIETVKNEHGAGDRAHWGGEDRRARLLFIYMDRGKLWGFWSSVLSALVPLIYKGVASMYDTLETHDVRAEVDGWNETMSAERLSARIGLAILEAMKESTAGT
jgi:hypothetical protein